MSSKQNPIRRARYFYHRHKTKMFLGAGIVIGYKLGSAKYGKLLEQDMLVELTPANVKNLLDGTFGTLISESSEKYGGTIYITLDQPRP